MKKYFWAYSDRGYKVSDSISEAVQELNKNELFDIETWEVMGIDGRSIPNTVISHIDNCEIFICDITNLNENVLFELGYAIAKRKAIRIFINISFDGIDKVIKTFDLISSIGYTKYNNSHDLIAKIWDMLETSDIPLLNDLLERVSTTSIKNILYMKSIRETEESSWISRAVRDLCIECVIDDPTEAINQSLEWYVSALINCNAYIAHFQSNIEGCVLRNQRISFVSGIAKGLGMPILLLASNEFDAPLDYKRDIVRYGDKQKCEEQIRNWFDENETKIKDIQSSADVHRDLRAASKLREINLGQNVAENEAEELMSYYVETSSFREAQNRNLSIFIGRKGVGKTANLYRLAKELENKHNHICVIKPVQYEIEGIIEVMRSISPAEKGYLVQSVWKYLIYTELLKTIYHQIKDLPAHVELRTPDKAIIEFVEKNKDIVLCEFSERFENVVQQLLSSNETEETGNKEYRIRVSEILHESVLSQTRRSLADYCGSKERIFVLIDNLDKSWVNGADLQLVSNFLFGLLDVVENIIRDFSKDSSWDKKVSISLILFLREDIFSVMKKYAPEADKLPIKMIIWNDSELLLRIIEERMKRDGIIDIWSEFFCDSVDGMKTKEYLISRILPKPRDLITLVSSALENAINRKHSIIEERDIIDATTKYSSFAYNTLITELQVEYSGIEDFLLNLLGDKAIISEATLVIRMQESGIAKEKTGELLEMLCQMSFLGFEIRPGEFRFCYSSDDYKRYKILAQKLVSDEPEIKRYRIHTAFCAELMIEE